MGASGRPHRSPFGCRGTGALLCPSTTQHPSSIKLGWPGCPGTSCLPSTPATHHHPFALTSCHHHPHRLCQPHHPWAARGAQGAAPCRAVFRSQQQGAARRSAGPHNTPSTAVQPNGSLTQKGWLWGACVTPRHRSRVPAERRLPLALQLGLPPAASCPSPQLPASLLAALQPA